MSVVNLITFIRLLASLNVFVQARRSSPFMAVKGHLPNAHANTDDNQLYLSFKPGNIATQLEALTVIKPRILGLGCSNPQVEDKLR